MNTLWSHIEVATKPQPIWLIGDLDGKYDNMITHLLSVGGIKSGEIWKDAAIPIWTGWNMKVIFSGDILADRHCDGFQILLAIANLRQQAQREWWDITILAGNHEERMIGYLVGRYDHLDLWDLIGEKSERYPLWDYFGITELEWFISEEEELNGKKKRIAILEAMRKNEKWKMLLQEICNMKLVHIKWDSIHFHTQPSKWMLDDIATKYRANNNNLQWALDYINTNWTRVLTSILIQENENITHKNVYKDIAKKYLHTLNGTRVHIRNKRQNPENHEEQITPLDHPTYGYMRDAGIRYLCHGHTDNKDLKIPNIRVINLNRRSISRAPWGSKDNTLQTVTKVWKSVASFLFSR